MFRFQALAAMLALGLPFAAPRAAAGGADAAPAPPAPAESVAVRAIGSRYGANWLHRALLGADYRALWTQPVSIPVLDLETFGGGLTPVSRGGGQQTVSLRFHAAGGGDYYFRSIDKNPVAHLPPEFVGTAVASVVQDQTSAQLPGASLLVAPLLTAAGVLNGEPHLFILPDDERLGEFRSLAGLVGILEPRIAGTWGGAAEIINGDELFKRVGASPDDRVDVRALLKARLMDILVGDWDRHRDQWSWARFGDAVPRVWVPVPRDRDFALVCYEGWALGMARVRMPQLIQFGPGYGSVLGLTWNGRELDRRFLLEADRPVWEAVVAEIRTAITDSVITAAVHRLPPEYEAAFGKRLTTALEKRRDALGTVAASFYRMLSEQAEVHATDAGETAVVRIPDPRTVDVQLFSAGVPGERRGTPYYQRTFSRDDAREVRIFLGGGRDSLVVEGPADPQIRLRVIGGEGDDVLNAGPVETLRLYDEDPGTVVLGREDLDVRRYVPPPKRIPNEIPPRDWGHLWEPAVHVTAAPNLGLLFGAGLTRTNYGFRKLPYASEHRFRAGFASDPSTFRTDYRGRFRRANAPQFGEVRLSLSGFDDLYFYGFGNEFAAGEARSYYRVRQKQAVMDLSVVAPAGPHLHVTAGTTVRYVTNEDRPGTLITAQAPYGSDRFGQIGVRAGIGYTSRRLPSLGRSGVAAAVEGNVYPAWWDVTETYGEVHGEATGYLRWRVPLEPALLLRAGGKALWGRFPYFDAAFIGEHGTVRLGRENRYAGDSSAYGTAELYVTLAHIFLGVPSDVGLVGLADTGRVHVDGEASQAWHPAAGGGVWLSMFDRANTISLTVAQSKEETALHFQASFGFF